MLMYWNKFYEKNEIFKGEQSYLLNLSRDNNLVITLNIHYHFYNLILTNK